MFSELAFEADIWEAVKESDAVLVTDEVGVITWITGTCERLFGYNVRNELLGRSVDELVPSAIKGKHVEFRKAFWADPRPRSMGTRRVLEGQHKDGHTILVSVTLVPWVIGGRRQVKASVAEMSGVALLPKESA